MEILEFAVELILDLIQEGCFRLIRKYVKSKFLRGILYVLSVLLVVLLAFGIVVGMIWLGGKAVIGILEWLGSFFA